MKNYSTKRALIASILMLALCCSMLLGTTYAWFTDSVTSSNNVIKTGKLEIGFDKWDETANSGAGAWVSAEGGASVPAGQRRQPDLSGSEHAGGCLGAGHSG